MSKVLGKHSIKHTCGHTVQYVACPPLYAILLLGESAAYDQAIEAHRAYQKARPCEDCESLNQDPRQRTH